MVGFLFLAVGEELIGFGVVFVEDDAGFNLFFLLLLLLLLFLLELLLLRFFAAVLEALLEHVDVFVE